MRLLIYFLVLMLAGCEALQPKVLNSLQGSYPQSEKPIDHHKLAEDNTHVLKERYQDEWAFNQTDKSSSPQRGIALSGGGTRSAYFNMGVLRGLHELGILKQMDVISSVSGGGYTASWYYLQHFYSPEYEQKDLRPISDNDLFRHTDKFQVHLSTHGELMGTTSFMPIRYTEYAFYLLATLASMPINLVANGLWGWHLNEVPMRRIYQNGIEREYHVVPKGDEDGDGGYNEKEVFGFSIGVEKEVNFEQFRDFVKSEGLPFPIINTTADIDDYHISKNSMSSHVFEFTPLSYGSDYYGYNKNHPITVNKAYAISGAAFDSKILSNDFYSMFLSSINIDLGYYIDNAKLTENQRFYPRLLPWPFYLFSGRHQNDISGTSIYLSDGGHIENLGAFSLIRRLTRNIIISDAEADPHYQFDSYIKLQEAVRNELGAKLHVQLIDERLKEFDSCKNLLNDKEKKKCIKDIPDPSTPMPPIMEGKISSFPYMENRQETDITINVLYIKPVVDKGRIKEPTYPISIGNYYLLHENDKINHVTKQGPFPQESTADQTYSPYQVSAYQDLGYKIIMDNKPLFGNFIPVHK